MLELTISVSRSYILYKNFAGCLLLSGCYFSLVPMLSVPHCMFRSISLITYSRCLQGLFFDASKITPLVSMLPAVLAKSCSTYNPMVYALGHPRFRAVSSIPSIRKILFDMLISCFLLEVSVYLRILLFAGYARACILVLHQRA